MKYYKNSLQNRKGNWQRVERFIVMSWVPVFAQTWCKGGVAREMSDFYTLHSVPDRSPGAAGLEMPLLMKPSAKQWRKMANWGWLSLTRWWMRTSWSKPWSISGTPSAMLLLQIYLKLLPWYLVLLSDQMIKALQMPVPFELFFLSNLLMGQICLCLWQIHQEQSFHKLIWNNVCNKKLFMMGKEWEFSSWKLNGKKIPQQQIIPDNI